ncbi:class I SAM-dependent methyltransferase [Tropicimonas sediminicola]|uniref:Methyltransferase domain-containing protein n=1 Tax=Tropicimonas sediminicola TaxID=1031541 RepID=A0A239M158_9RHOB|nr:class I SAM-dependent methyltransferase [Tropicimonas sediminicola]SNT36270.1 Methyltransferase domain-containing protein [Tropicimonas sediminicola]
MTAPRPTNRDIRDEIRDYWSDRAASFDADPGHRIADGAEMAAWTALFQKHLGAARGRKLLDLASGTGEIARLCNQMGFDVTGLDWAEPMLARARNKLPDVTFVQADAERTMLPSDSMDVIVTRHLVWTLVDPAAAFVEWRRVLAPGGMLLLIDGDFVTPSWLVRLLGVRSSTGQGTAARHQRILGQVYFAQGTRANRVAELLAEAGFVDIRIDTRLGRIHRAQAREMGWRKSLLRLSEHRYAIRASKHVATRSGA